MSAREQIEAALADAPAVVATAADAKAVDSAIGRVAALPPECSDDLQAYARALLDDFSSSSSERLLIVLEGMHRRGQDASELAARALTAPGSAERELYVDLLAQAYPDRAAAPLTAAFDFYDEDSDVDGFLRARILEALGKIEARDAAETVAEGLEHDDSDRVRLAAIEALDRLDARDEAPALIERLEQDNDPEVVAAAAGLLGRWRHTDALPALEALAASDWAQRSPEVRDGVSGALERLR